MENNLQTDTCKNKFELRIGSEKLRHLLSQYSALPVLILLVIVASLTSNVFFTSNNILNVLRQVAANGIISIGMTYVILTGGIDISVGSIVGISSIMFASAFQPEGFVAPYSGISNLIRILVPDGAVSGVVVAGMIVILICAALGMINGLGVTKGKLPPFIMTMGTLTLFRGIALLVCEGRPLYMSATYAEKISWLGGARVLNIPAPVIVFAIVAIIAGLILGKTVYGRYIRAIGGNQEAARVAGIRIDRFKISVYAVSAGLAALAGILITARTTTGEPMLGGSYELDAIAATVIGGTVLTGGVGSIIGTVFGAIIMGVINNLLNLNNVSPYFQYIIKGTIIIVAVLIRSGKKTK